MHDHRYPAMTRRAVLRRCVALAGVATVPTIGLASPHTPATQYGSVAKAAVHYQDHPNGNAACVHCINFIPGASTSALGHCHIVAGRISPHGWCLAFAAG